MNRRPRSRSAASACAFVALAFVGGCSTAPSSVPPVAPDTPASLSATAQTTCLAAAQRQPPPRALAMARVAQAEHAAWGGSTMDAEGRLIESGQAEAEDRPRSLLTPAPWQRVLGYWRAVDPATDGLPYAVRYGALRPADRGLLQAELAQVSAMRLAPSGGDASGAGGEGEGGGQGGVRPGLSSSALAAMQTALDRVAVVDTPWSAAFVSWVARQSGLARDEFVFSEAHADYAGAAWQAGAQEAAGNSTRNAMRTCDLAHTPPRAGDLVCQARAGSSDLDSYDRIGDVLAARPTGGEPVAMHCDVVTAVDATGFDAVGGNVLQSVTLRRMAFTPGQRVLDPSYFAGRCIAGETDCTDRHMSRQPWSLLLQWR